MIIQHLRLDAINGSLVELDGVKDASFDEHTAHRKNS